MTRRLLFVVLLGLAVGAAALWRSAPSGGAGEILVLRERTVSGPARVWISPWASRAVLPRSVETVSDLPLDLGQGSRFAVSVRTRWALDPARLGVEGRAIALGGVAGLEKQAASWSAAALESVSRDSRADPRVLLSRGDALSTAVREALKPLLVDGIDLVSVSAEVQLGAEDARRHASADARRLGTPPLTRVLYIGLDGADWAIADPLIARGDLPVLARLVRNGVRADLLSYEPMMSPLLWTTAVTGRSPDVHGIFDFTLSDAAGGMVPISSRFRASPAIWEILSSWGDMNAFVNFWATHPAEEIEGVLVSDIVDSLLAGGGKRKPIPSGAVWPEGFLETVPGMWTTDDAPLDALRAYWPAATASDLRDAQSYWNDETSRKAYKETEEGERRKVPPVAFLVRLAVTSHNLERVALRLLERPDFGVVGVYFGDIDQVGHNFQHLAPPPHPLADPDERRRFGDVVENTYKQQDRMLGRLIEAAGSDTLVIIHSDHGFQWGEGRPRDVLPFTGGQPVEWHRMQGMFVAAGGPARRGLRVPDVTLYDIAPTILALRGVPPSETMPGRVRRDVLDPASASRLPESRIPDWDVVVGPRRYSASGDQELDAARREMVDRLRALGYVGGGVGEEEKQPAAAQGEPADPAEGPAGEDRPRVTYYRTKATWLMNQDRFADAEAALLEANRIEPLPKTYSLLSESRAARGDLHGAVAALEEGLARFPDELPVSAVLWMVELQLQRGDLPAARRDLEQGARGRDPRSAPLIVARGRIAEASGDAADARRRYLEALQADPREVRAAQRFAALATTPDERARLEPFLRRGLQADPRIEVYWQMLGLIRIDARDPAGAADAFKRAADLDPSDQASRLNEALAALGAGQRDRARKRLEALASSGSEIPAVWASLGRVRAETGDWPGARSALERAIALGAEDPRLRELLEAVKRRGGAASQ